MLRLAVKFRKDYPDFPDVVLELKEGEDAPEGYVLMSVAELEQAKADCTESRAALNAIRDKQEYAPNRADAFPEPGEQLDGIWKALHRIKSIGIDIGTDAEEMLDKIKQVKEDLPKPDDKPASAMLDSEVQILTQLTNADTQASIALQEFKDDMNVKINALDSSIDLLIGKIDQVSAALEDKIISDAEAAELAKPWWKKILGTVGVTNNE